MLIVFIVELFTWIVKIRLVQSGECWRGCSSGMLLFGGENDLRPEMYSDVACMIVSVLLT